MQEHQNRPPAVNNGIFVIYRQQRKAVLHRAAIEPGGLAVELFQLKLIAQHFGGFPGQIDAEEIQYPDSQLQPAAFTPLPDACGQSQIDLPGVGFASADNPDAVLVNEIVRPRPQDKTVVQLHADHFIRLNDHFFTTGFPQAARQQTPVRGNGDILGYGIFRIAGYAGNME